LLRFKIHCHSGVVGQGERELNGRRNGRSTFSINTFFRKCSRYNLMENRYSTGTVAIRN